MRVCTSMPPAGCTRVIGAVAPLLKSIRIVVRRLRSQSGFGRADGSGEREGKIKGAARAGPECESARGFGAARQPAVPVLHANTNLRTSWVRDVPSATVCATYHVGPRHGIA